MVAIWYLRSRWIIKILPSSISYVSQWPILSWMTRSPWGCGRGSKDSHRIDLSPPSQSIRVQPITSTSRSCRQWTTVSQSGSIYMGLGLTSGDREPKVFVMARRTLAVCSSHSVSFLVRSRLYAIRTCMVVLRSRSRQIFSYGLIFMSLYSLIMRDLRRITSGSSSLRVKRRLKNLSKQNTSQRTNPGIFLIIRRVRKAYIRSFQRIITKLLTYSLIFTAIKVMNQRIVWDLLGLRPMKWRERNQYLSGTESGHHSTMLIRRLLVK